jgi:hypothetical protein
LSAAVFVGTPGDQAASTIGAVPGYWWPRIGFEGFVAVAKCVLLVVLMIIVLAVSEAVVRGGEAMEEAICRGIKPPNVGALVAMLLLVGSVAAAVTASASKLGLPPVAIWCVCCLEYMLFVWTVSDEAWCRFGVAVWRWAMLTAHGLFLLKLLPE